MDPITAFLTANAGAIALGSAGVSAASAIMQGNSQAASYDQQARASERNAQVADLQARQAYDAGTQNELAQRRSAGQQQSEVRAAVAESGFDSGSGTALAIQAQSARDLEMDALQTRYEALLQGQGFEQQAVMDRYTADTLRRSGRNARRAGYIGAATSALTGVAGMYGSGLLGKSGGSGIVSSLSPGWRSSTLGSGLSGGSTFGPMLKIR